MFGKCLKHEFRATKRQLVPLFIAMLGVSVLAGLFLGLDDRLPTNEDSLVWTTLNNWLLGLSMFALFAIIIAVVVVSFVMIVRRFYTSFFTDEGYLSFTLPVTINQHILSKLTSAYVWEVLSALVCIACVIIMSLVYGIVSGALFVTEDVTTDEISELEWLLGTLKEDVGEGYIVTVIVLGILYAALTLAASILMVYLAISVGCMIAKKHRVIGGIVSYYVISMIFSTITSVAESVFTYFGYSETGNYTDYYQNLILVMIIVGIVLTLVQILVSYITTKWILTKKLNLD